MCIETLHWYQLSCVLFVLGPWVMTSKVTAWAWARYMTYEQPLDTHNNTAICSNISMDVFFLCWVCVLNTRQQTVDKHNAMIMQYNYLCAEHSTANSWQAQCYDHAVWLWCVHILSKVCCEHSILQAVHCVSMQIIVWPEIHPVKLSFVHPLIHVYTVSISPPWMQKLRCLLLRFQSYQMQLRFSPLCLDQVRI